LSYLINTDSFWPSVESLQKDGKKYVELASVDYRIPAVWFMFFNESDLIEVDIKAGCESISGESSKFTKVFMPCTTKEKALENIKSSFSFFVSIFGNEEISEGYLQKTIELFIALDHKYVALDCSDYLLMNLEQDEWHKFSICFKRNEEAGRYIKEFCGFSEGVVPYSVEEFYSTPTLEDQEKINNASALDPQFSNIPSRLSFPSKPKVKKQKKNQTTTAKPKQRPKVKYTNLNMILWQGYGFLVPILFLVFLVLFAQANKIELVKNNVPNSILFWCVILASSISYALLGRWLNTRSGRFAFDRIKTSEIVELRSKHTFLYIPVEYWAVVLIGLTVLLEFIQN